MVKQFKGQVKISDIQRAFEEILGKINTIIGIYNNSGEVQEIDYTVGDATLGSTGYTLTVGGLKQVMDIIKGSIIGAKVFRVTDNQIKISDGILVTEKEFVRLPDSVINLPTGTTGDITLYFNTTTNKYEFTKQLVDTTIEKEIPALTLQQLSDGSYVLDDIKCNAYSLTGTDNICLFSGVKDASNNIVEMQVNVPNLPTGRTYKVLTGQQEFGLQLDKLPHKSIGLGSNNFKLNFLSKNIDEYKKTLSASGFVAGYFWKENDKNYFIPFIVCNSHNPNSYDSEAFTSQIIANVNGLPISTDASNQVICTGPFTHPPYNSGYAEDANYGGGIRLKPTDSSVYETISPAWLWDTVKQYRDIYNARDNANTGSDAWIYEELRVGSQMPPKGISQPILGRSISIQYEPIYATSIQGQTPTNFLTAKTLGSDINGDVIQVYDHRNADGKAQPSVVGGVRQQKLVMSLTNYETKAKTDIEQTSTNKILEACNMIFYACKDFYDGQGDINNSAVIRPDMYSPRFDTKTTMVSVNVKNYPDPTGYKITDVCLSRKSDYLNNIKCTFAEDIDGTFKINILDNLLDNKIYTYGGANNSYYPINTDTNDSGKFIAGMEGNQASNNKNNYYRLFFDGVQVSSNAQNGKHHNSFVNMVNFLYVPRKVPNPYTVQGRDVSRGFDYEEELTLRGEEQSSENNNES